MTAAVKEFLLDTERLQHSQLRRMAQRLSLLTTLGEVRAWRIRRAGVRTAATFLFTQAYNDALIFGDPAGAAFLAVQPSRRGRRDSPGEAHTGGPPRDASRASRR